MKKKGRPKGPEKVYFRAYVTPAVADLLSKQIANTTCAVEPVRPEGKVVPVEEGLLKREVDLHKANVAALLADIERLTDDNSALKYQLDEALQMDLDEKGKLGWKLYYELKRGKNEFDQS